MFFTPSFSQSIIKARKFVPTFSFAFNAAQILFTFMLITGFE